MRNVIDYAPGVTGADLEPHRRYLGAVLYRLTGDAAEADDLVQETFARALVNPEVATDGSRPLRPWLLRVAVHLGIDALRARKARGYPGPWLPTPITTDEEVAADEEPAARYELLESAQLAFLVALEALSPQQRAVVLLRDVFELSVEETAEALETTGNAVKVAHHHARAALAGYDAQRLRPTRAAQARARELMARFLLAVSTGDAAAARALLAEDVVATGDGGGRYIAGRRPVVGAERVARLYLRVASQLKATPRIEVVMVNGMPALEVRVDEPHEPHETSAATGGGAKPRTSPRSLIQFVPHPTDDRIARVFSILVPEKLGAVRGKSTLAGP